MLTFKIWVAALLSAALPFASVAWLWKGRAGGGADWALTLAVTAALSTLAFVATPWAMTSYYLRYVLVPLFALAAFSSFRKVGTNPRNDSAARGRGATAAKAVALAALVGLDALALRAYFHPWPRVELSFPLSGGAYYVIQGGNSALTSPFHRRGPDRREEYALDIVKLNRAGNRAAGVYPRALTSYAVYGATIHSPCDGEIVELTDGVPENPIGDKGSNPSNQVVIRCRGARVTLAHMRSGSFAVRAGQQVREGQPLAEVGNAGHSSEPHLHIDAVRDSAEGVEPLPISFGGRVLSLNSVVIR